jgi:segregation and condensation protein A
MPYKVKLDTFEGPLDLLLFLIKKEEVDIYDIRSQDHPSVFGISRNYSAFGFWKSQAIFILMAATLMRIKSADALAQTGK